MFFVLSKLFWIIAQPPALVLLLGLLALILSWRKGARLGAGCLYLGLLVLFITGFTNAGGLIIAPLEDRFPRPVDMPEDIDGIIVLGGGIDNQVTGVRGGYEFASGGERYLEALRLSRVYPNAPVIVTGGNGRLTEELEPEADVAARFFAAFGLPPERLVLEGRSRNTRENAEMTTAALDPEPGDTFLLVTSGYHMPRSVGLFRRAGLNIVPYPVDFQTTGRDGLRFPLEDQPANLRLFSTALREWIGLIAYWATGQIDEVLPGPAATVPPQR